MTKPHFAASPADSVPEFQDDRRWMACASDARGGSPLADDGPSERVLTKLAAPLVIVGREDENGAAPMREHALAVARLLGALGRRIYDDDPPCLARVSKQVPDVRGWGRFDMASERVVMVHAETDVAPSGVALLDFADEMARTGVLHCERLAKPPCVVPVVAQIIATATPEQAARLSPGLWTVFAGSDGEWHHVGGPAPLPADDARAMDALLGRRTQ